MFKLLAHTLVLSSLVSFCAEEILLCFALSIRTRHFLRGVVRTSKPGHFLASKWMFHELRGLFALWLCWDSMSTCSDPPSPHSRAHDDSLQRLKGGSSLTTTFLDSKSCTFWLLQKPRNLIFFFSALKYHYSFASLLCSIEMSPGREVGSPCNDHLAHLCVSLLSTITVLCLLSHTWNVLSHLFYPVS